MKNIIIASTSTVHAGSYLDYLFKELTILFRDAKEVLFIPYARPSGLSHDLYTERVAYTFLKINKKLRGIHTFENKIEAIKKAQAIYVGGGNTFVLLNELYKFNLMPILKESILKGTPYLGASAGSNICGLSIKTTNDMPIIYPPSFNALGLIPFNINPHFLDPDANSKHMGETRETRILEFLNFNTQTVIGLREGSWLQVKDDSIILKGDITARIFEYGKKPFEAQPGTELNPLK